MRVLAIGDIHGCFGALSLLVETVPITDDDLVIALGDYIDRGPQSRDVINWLIARQARDRLISILGNHEELMLNAQIDARHMMAWLVSGGTTTIASYSEQGQAFGLDVVPDDHWDFIRKCQPYHQTDTHIFVHANLLADVPMEHQPPEVLRWELFDGSEPHYSNKVMVCGHTAQQSGRPNDLGFAVCIDTWVYGEGYLTCLDIDTGHYWQAAEDGRTREGDL